MFSELIDTESQVNSPEIMSAQDGLQRRTEAIHPDTPGPEGRSWPHRDLQGAAGTTGQKGKPPLSITDPQTHGHYVITSN